jgi:hypothetical protein
MCSWPAARTQVLERIAQLREQAAILHALAGSFDIPNIRDQLLDLAERCEVQAKSIEEHPMPPEVIVTPLYQEALLHR